MWTRPVPDGGGWGSRAVLVGRQSEQELLPVGDIMSELRCVSAGVTHF